MFFTANGQLRAIFLCIFWLGLSMNTWAQQSTTDSTTLRSTQFLEEITVSASRTAERVMEAPITVEHIDARTLARRPATELIASLGAFKGIDVSQSSWLISSFSTRGFNSSKAERVVQLIDFVDVTSPTASLYYGNWMGIPDLDLDKIDVVFGANSALYGTNALNGVLMMTSKDPFAHRGTQVAVRGGSRNMLDLQLRHVQLWNDRLALKWNMSYFSGDEFVAASEEAIRPVTNGGLAGADPLNNPTGSGWGWNALNRYGDQGFSVTNPSLRALNNGNAYRLYAPGFTEAELLWARAPGDFFPGPGSAYKAGNLKLNPSLHWQFNPRVKALYEYRYALSNGIFQSSSRFAQRAMQYDLHRLELSGKDWFVRAYTLYDFGGKAYDLGALGNGLMNTPLAPGNSVAGTSYPTFAQNYFSLWNQVFTAARTGGLSAGTPLAGVFVPDAQNGLSPTPFVLKENIPNGLSVEAAQQLAARLAAGVQLPARSPLFERLREQIVGGVGLLDIHGSRTVRGAAFQNNARFADLSFQKEWTLSPTTQLIGGGSTRAHRLQSNGTLFSDGDKSPILPGTNELLTRSRILNYEGGVYAQLRQSFWEKRLQLAAAGRYDQFQNFGARFSPRVSGVLTLGAQRQHALRASYSQAYRQPAQLDQYIYLDFGGLLVQGNISGGFQGLNAVSVLPNGQPNPQFLQPQSIGSLRPEQAHSWEVGYKAQLAKGFYVDLSYYEARYQDFIGTLRFYGREDGLLPSGRPLPTPTGDFAKPTSDRTRGRLIQVWANADQQVRTRGFLLATDYFQSKALHLTANYTWSWINENDVPGLILGFNTPTHKVNVGLHGQSRGWEYSAQYRYQTAYTFFMPFDEGRIAAFGTLQAQLGYQLPMLKSTLRLGATNLTNAQAISAYGSAAIGRVVYVGWVYGVGQN